MDDINEIFNMKLLPILFQFKRSSIDGEIFNFKEFLSDVNHLAKAEKQKLEKIVEELVKESPENSQDIYENYSDQFHTYDSKYVELANNGLLVTAYSFFEHQLKDLNNTLLRFILNIKGTFPKNSSFSYAQNLRNNIYAMTNLDFSSVENTWVAIDEFRKIRNLIVHNGANLVENDVLPIASQPKYVLISLRPEIKLNEENGDFFIIDKELVFSFLDLTQKYLLDLIEILSSIDKDDIK